MNAERRLLDDCFVHDRDRLRHDEALAILTSRVTCVAGEETVSLARAAGRILARPVTAPRAIPAFDNAAVDGYALAHASLADGETRLPVAMRIAAGHAAEDPLPAGAAARIFTGAVMPEGADTCIMQEDARIDGDDVIIPAGVRKGINVRRAGEDVAEGDEVVAAGVRLRPQEMAAIASTGAAEVICRKRLKVALVSTGDELLRPGQAFTPGAVYDANHYQLLALLGGLGMEPVDFAIVADTRDAVEDVVGRALQECDLIMTSGGASKGESDFIVETIARLGALHAWQLAIKPGRPLAFGQIGDKVFIGLPGNPVAAFVCFLLYAQPVLSLLAGMTWKPPQRYPVAAGFDIAGKKPDRREFLRGWIEGQGMGARAMRYPRDGSGLISGITRARGLIEIGEDVTSVSAGEPVAYIPFSEFGVW